MRTLLVLFMLTFLLQGCGGVIDYFFLGAPEDTAQELYENGMSAMQEKDYGNAVESFSALGDRYPFSPYAIPAKIALGDAYALDKQYFEAAAVYEEFLGMHPRHESVDYVLFQAGKCKYESHRSIDLPQNVLSEAIELFQRIPDSYPDSKYREQAVEYIGKCRQLLAEHELFVADFYFKSGSYKSAWARYQYIIDNYADIEDVSKVAQSKVKAAYFYAQEKENDTDRHPSGLKFLYEWL